MDDDIDIEEHDVMDNPRIKSIFPDLSCVKIEIPDEEDIDEEQYGVLQEPTEEPQEVMYQYEYSFETTTDDVPAGAQSQDENQDYEDENGTYFYNNEIILGSKPPLDLEILYEEALNSNPIVYLENWENKLKTSSCFCTTCEILFPTVNALDSHKMISHSYLVALDIPQKNTARKSTVTSKFCNHCSKTFPDDTSLIKHLYELLPLNNFPQINDQKIEQDMVQEKRVPAPGPWPKKIKSTSHVITKIPQKKVKIEPKEVKIETDFDDKEIRFKFKSKLQREGKFFASSSLVPKSTLFQCNGCQIGFLSCFSASQHSKYCVKKALSFNKCGICKRKIRIKDVKTHELQHNYNDKLKIYTINKSIYERVLCKCPKCLSCFDELGFWAHYQRCKKSEKKSVYCPICDVHIAASRYRGHSLKHSTKKLTKKDFIVIEFYDQNKMRVNDSRVEIIKIQKKEREKLYREKHKKKLSWRDSKKNDDDITLYYCEFCGCCQYILNYKGHIDGSCKESTSKRYCDKCGLCFTPKSIESHLVLHEKRSFSLKDIKIVSLSTGKCIDPPMSEFFECQKCLKHFLCWRTMNLHNCKTEKYITCKICTKKFNIPAYKIHKIFHSVDKLMPELMKKYNSINNMWNVMYLCQSCELVTMTYDSAVTHSQGHLNYIMSDLYKECVVCDLKIAEKEFVLHEKLHSNNESIERESFKILKYNHEDLFKREWLMLFKDLPKEHRQQILSKSIYRFTRSVKMQIEVNAPTDDTKYFCIHCNTFVDGSNIKQHMRSNCLRNHKLVCDICHEIFKTLKQYLSHTNSHESTPKSHRIVTFNNECDKEFNNHLSLIESKDRKSTKDVPLSKLRELLLSDTVKATYKLYKCAKCETCVTLKSSTSRHRCISGNKIRYCGICEQYFCAKKKSLHLEAHRKKPLINKDSFYIVYFNGDEKTAKRTTRKVVAAKTSPKRDVTAKISPKKVVTAKVSPKKLMIAKIFQCQCGLHFTSMKSVETHLDKCSPKLEVSKETCSKCNLVFPTEVLVTHLINHHHKETKIVIVKVAKTQLFKCPNCSICFINMDNFDSHTENCDPKNGVQCKNCRLTYSSKCFPKHLCSSEDTTYINRITVMKVEKQTTVYKCDLCDIAYLRRNSFRYHYFEVNHLLKKPPTPCEICGLKFTNCSYQKHIKFHSSPNADYKIKIMDNLSGNFVFLTGTNPGKKDGNTHLKRLSARKRKSENLSEDSDSVKKVKSNDELDMPLSDRRASRRATDKASTSNDSKLDLDETPGEFIVPDEVSDHISENISDADDASMVLPDKMKNPQKKNALSYKVKSRILVKGYSKKLFKCVYCNQHYMKEASFAYHVRSQTHKETTENFECDICGLEFSKHTLPRHKYVHHDNMRLTREDFIILTETSLSKDESIKSKNDSKILDVSSDVHDDTEVSENESLNDSQVLSDSNVNDIGDTKVLSDINVTDTCDNVDSDANDISDTKVVSDVRDVCNTNDEITDFKICYYKCSDCNVCFVDQKMCLEHSLNHEILDPKTYIQCKICDFQFLIDSLKEHMVLHHNTDFKIECLTIHEYKCTGISLDPKIDIYQAVDKLQSRLVSTTTDVGVV